MIFRELKIDRTNKKRVVAHHDLELANKNKIKIKNKVSSKAVSSSKKTESRISERKLLLKHCPAKPKFLLRFIKYITELQNLNCKYDERKVKLIITIQSAI